MVFISKLLMELYFAH